MVASNIFFHFLQQFLPHCNPISIILQFEHYTKCKKILHMPDLL